MRDKDPEPETASFVKKNIWGAPMNPTPAPHTDSDCPEKTKAVEKIIKRLDKEEKSDGMVR